MGIPFARLIEKHCGGIRGGWDNLKAVIPGGSSVRMVPADSDHRHADGFRQPRQIALGLGTAAVIVMDKSTDFDRGEFARIPISTSMRSCGQCTPCREGTGLDVAGATRMAEGRAHSAKIDMLLEVTKQIEATPSRAGRCGGVADPGPDRAFSVTRIETAIATIRARLASTTPASSIPRTWSRRSDADAGRPQLLDRKPQKTLRPK